MGISSLASVNEKVRSDESSESCQSIGRISRQARSPCVTQVSARCKRDPVPDEALSEKRPQGKPGAFHRLYRE